MKKLIIAVIAVASTMGIAQAQTGYVGAGIVSADHKYNIGGATGLDGDGYKASGKLFGGVDINQTFAVEAGYAHFGSADANYSIAGVPGSVSSKGHSLYVAGKATMPVNEQFSLFGKLGVARNKYELNSATAAYNFDDSKTEAYGALGAQYNLSKQVALSLEVEHYGKNRDNAAKLGNAVTVAARYNF